MSTEYVKSSYFYADLIIFAQHVSQGLKGIITYKKFPRVIFLLLMMIMK